MDDNFVNLSSIRLMLEMMGYEGKIKCFQSSLVAIDFIQKLCHDQDAVDSPKIDLITVDSMLPIVNGIELVKELNKLMDEQLFLSSKQDKDK